MQYLIEAALEGAGITRFVRLAIENDLANGHLRIVLPETPLVSEPVHALHPFWTSRSAACCACSSTFWLTRSVISPLRQMMKSTPSDHISRSRWLLPYGGIASIFEPHLGAPGFLLSVKGG